MKQFVLYHGSAKSSDTVWLTSEPVSPKMRTDPPPLVPPGDVTGEMGMVPYPPAPKSGGEQP